MKTPSSLPEMLLDSLRHLAMSSEDQLLFLTHPSDGVRASPDELILDYHYMYEAVRDNQADLPITGRQMDKLTQIESVINDMKSDNHKIWTYEALRDEDVWLKLRGLARNYLSEFHESRL